MGKNRARKAAKAANVFAIARGAAAGKARGKGRARPVTSGLKKVSGSRRGLSRSAVSPGLRVCAC